MGENGQGPPQFKTSNCTGAKLRKPGLAAVCVKRAWPWVRGTNAASCAQWDGSPCRSYANRALSLSARNR